MISQVKIQRMNETVPMPRFLREGDAAFDLSSRENIVIESGKKEIIPTGIMMAVPKGHAGLIWDRSGIAANNGVHVLAGVIDSNYRGEIRVVLANLGEEPFAVEKGMRIAQLLIQPVICPSFVEVDSLEETARGENGFGSTGK